MDLFEAIRTRRSIRLYKDKPVEEAKLGRILEAARLAPSASNRQPWKFIVITDAEVKEKLRSAYDREWFISAPIIIVACAFPANAWFRRDKKEYWQVDVAIAMQHLVLAARAEGLGTCWVAAFDEKEAKKALGIPKDVQVVVMTPLGYPAEEKGVVTDRKPLAELISYNHW